MKTKLLPLGLLLLLLCDVPTIMAAPTIPTIRLPTDLVTMNAVYGDTSYFKMTLSDIPLGYDITNGVYRGWCFQKTINMRQHVNHTVLLYPYSDPLLPTEFHTSHWEKINYLLNHKQGNQTSIQLAIWYFTDDVDCYEDPNACAMVADAEAHGDGFIPTIGDIIAIPIEGIPAIQLTFLELTIPTPQDLEGLVWNDHNANGLQDRGEPGMNNIMVHLYHNDNALIKTATTDSKGYYTFTELPPGAYYLQVLLPGGYRFSPQNMGADDAIDSDVDASGKTPVFLITIDQSPQRWDVGMYTTVTPTPSTPQNHRPTADGTAGEPYDGLIHEIITFDGSRSYDRDGRIIAWRWSFGDGTNSTGEITTHSYTQAGDFTVTLTVTDNMFASDVYTTTATIRAGNNPPSQPLLSGPTVGHANTSYEYIITATDPNADTIRYLIDWDDGYQDTSGFFASGDSLSINHTWQHVGFYTLRVSAQDQNNATSESVEKRIAIDVQYVGTLGYLIDMDSDGIFDLFLSNSTSRTTTVLLLETQKYLIDADGDGAWDIVYDPLTSQYEDYHPVPFFVLLLFVILIIVFILLYALLRIKSQTRTLSSNKKKNK